MPSATPIPRIAQQEYETGNEGPVIPSLNSKWIRINFVGSCSLFENSQSLFSDLFRSSSENFSYEEIVYIFKI